jgi:hypothetical protein
MYLNAGEHYLDTVLNEYKNELPVEKFPFPKEIFI